MENKLPLGVHELTPGQISELAELDQYAKEEEAKLGRKLSLEEQKALFLQFKLNKQNNLPIVLDLVCISAIKATPMKYGEYAKLRGWDLMKSQDPEIDGYVLETRDHLQHWQPKSFVDSTYRNAKDATIDFGMATYFAKKGKRIARQGWNGAGMFAYLVPAAICPAQTGAAKAYFGEDAMVPYRAYWALKTAQEDIATWTPSGSDTLAEDWYVLD